MLSTKFQRLLAMAICLAIVLILAVPGGVRAQQDEANHIYELALALHADDTTQQNYTYWVNGNIGKDIGLPPLKLEIGKPMIAFNFSALDDSDPLDSTKLEGPYLLNFWASWCPPCREEFPLLLDAVKNKDLPIPVYFVDTLDKRADALVFLKQIHMEATVYTDTPDSKYAGLNLQQAVPQTFLIDADGNIQALHVGNMAPASIRFFAEIAAHPGIGGFDADHPDQMPPEATAAATAVATVAQ